MNSNDISSLQENLVTEWYNSEIKKVGLNRRRDLFIYPFSIILKIPAHSEKVLLESSSRTHIEVTGHD